MCGNKALTLQDLKDMKPFEMFASGKTIDNSSGINMSNSNRALQWVACRGGIHDWAIYIGLDGQSEEYVQAYGDKVTSESNIKKLIECDDEAFSWYRY